MSFRIRVLGFRVQGLGPMCFFGMASMNRARDDLETPGFSEYMVKSCPQNFAVHCNVEIKI